MQPRRNLQATVPGGDPLEGNPQSNNVYILCVAKILRVLVPWCVGPFLVWQLRTRVEDAVQIDFRSAKQVFGQVYQVGMREKPVHLGTDQVATGAARVLRATSRFPGHEQAALKIDL